MKRIVFFNIGWMANYCGITEADQLTGGYDYNGRDFGEVYNFLPRGNSCYGFVQRQFEEINLERIDFDNEGKSKLNDVLVILHASHPELKKRCIIGWYLNAVVYRKYQSKVGINSFEGSDRFIYNFKSKTKNCVLLPEYERKFLFNRGPKLPGQDTVWYSLKDCKIVNPVFIKAIIKYVESYEGVSNKFVPGRQKNILKRIEVEIMAIKAVECYFRKKGYEVKSVEEDNVGWDLIAQKNGSRLFIEVKGLSGSAIKCELTPNEYRNALLNHDDANYLICVVTNALTTQNLEVF